MMENIKGTTENSKLHITTYTSHRSYHDYMPIVTQLVLI